MGYAMSSRRFDEAKQFTLWKVGDGSTEIEYTRAIYGAGFDSDVLYRNKIDVTNIKYFRLVTIGRKQADAGSNFSLLLYVDGVSRGGSVWTDAIENPQTLQTTAGTTGVQEVKLKFNCSDTDDLLLKFAHCYYIMEEI